MKKSINTIFTGMLFGAALIMTGFTGCTKKDGAKDSSSSSVKTSSGLDKVTYISPTPLESFDYLAIYAGMTLGYFEEQGIELKLVEQSGTDDMKMVASGQAQFAYPSPGVFWSCIDAGITGVRPICNYDSIQIFGIATNKAAGIKTWADMKGKKVSMGADSWTSLVFPLFDGAGVDPKDVTFITYGSGSYEACKSGATEGLATWLSEYCQLLGQGYDFDYLDGNTGAPQVSNSLITSDALIKSNPDLVQRFVNALTKSMYFCYCNVEAAADLTLLHVPNLAIEWEGAYGAAVGDVQQLFGISAEEQKETIAGGIGKFDMKMAQNAADNLYKAGTISKKYNASDYYTNQFVENLTWSKADVEKDAAAYVCKSAQYVKSHK